MYNFLPKLKHDILYQLCLASIEIEPAEIDAILSLPRAEVLSDIDLLLQKFLADPEAFYAFIEKEEKETFLLIHCIYFLGALSASELLTTVLQIMELEEDILDFWLGAVYDFDWGTQLIHISKDHIPQLFEFIKRPNSFWQSRSIATESLERLVQFYPEKRKEINEHLDKLLEYLLKVKPKDPSYDTSAFTYMMYTIGAFKGDAFRLHAIQLHEQGKYQADIAEPFPDFLEMLKEEDDVQILKKESIHKQYELHLKKFVEDSDIDENIFDEFLANEIFNSMILPTLNHEELGLLYKHGLDIEHDKLKNILQLPRKTLIADLETMLLDYTKKVPMMDENKMLTLPYWIPHHCLHILAELKSVESLPTIFAFFHLDDDKLVDCFEDYLLKRGWQLLDDLCIDNLQTFENFLLQTEKAWQGKACVFRMLQQRHHKYEKERHAIVKIYARYIEQQDFTIRIQDGPKQGFHSVFLQRLLELRDPLFLPVAQQMFRERSNYTTLNIPQSEYLQLWHDPKVIFPPLVKMYSIFDRYYLEQSVQSGNISEEELRLKAVIGDDQGSKNLEKIGRNSPCPCGSGKKWKKCCGKN